LTKSVLQVVEYQVNEKAALSDDSCSW